MKGFAVLTMMFVLATGCVAAEHEAPEVAPVAAEALLTEHAAEGVLTEETAALFAPITANGYCEEMYTACAEACLDVVGSNPRACLRLCQRDYQECLEN